MPRPTGPSRQSTRQGSLWIAATHKSVAPARTGAVRLTGVAIGLVALFATACTPAAPAAPTAAPTATKPAAPASASSAAAKPSTSPAAASASPAAKPAASPAAKPGASPAPSPAAAPQRTFNEQAVASFYNGKTVTVLVANSPGGGYDTYARTLARNLGRFIPGNPNVIVQNMPGAGGLLMTNTMFNSSAKDGTVIGMMNRGTPAIDLVGTPEAQFKSTEFQWLGSMNNEVSICFSRADSAIKKFEDLYTTPMKVGGTGPGADTDVFPTFLNRLLGTKFDLATGYPGGNDINVAIERGELQGRCGYSYSSLISTRPQWVQDKYIITLTQMSLEKHPDMPTVPLILDFARNPEERQLMELLFSRQTMGRPLAAPPGVPAERVAALRTAFDRTMADPQFVNEANTSKLEISGVTGERVQEIVTSISKTPKELVTRFQELSAP